MEEGPVSLDEQEIWREMKRVLQLQEQHGLAEVATSEEGSSFYGEASDDEEGVWSRCNSRRVSSQRALLPSFPAMPFAGATLRCDPD